MDTKKQLRELVERERAKEPPLGQAACSTLRVEIWECRACGKDVPCRVEITYEPTPYPHVEEQPRFARYQECICGEKQLPDWSVVSNAAAEAQRERRQ